MNIYLIGMMGSGKSTTGKRLARELGREFVDCDSEIEARTGVSIPVIFDIEGETGFRKREQAVIEALCKRKRIVVATGGGTVLAEANRTLMRATGYVVYLDAPPELIRQRVMRSRSHGRPLLSTLENNQTLEQKLEQLLSERDPMYRELADLVVQPSRHGTVTLACSIAEALPREVACG